MPTAIQSLTSIMPPPPRNTNKNNNTQSKKDSQETSLSFDQDTVNLRSKKNPITMSIPIDPQYGKLVKKQKASFLEIFNEWFVDLIKRKKPKPQLKKVDFWENFNGWLEDLIQREKEWTVFKKQKEDPSKYASFPSQFSPD